MSFMENGTRPIEILLVEDNPGDARLTIEARRRILGQGCDLAGEMIL